MKRRTGEEGNTIAFSDRVLKWVVCGRFLPPPKSGRLVEEGTDFGQGPTGASLPPLSSLLHCLSHEPDIFFAMSVVDCTASDKLR